MDLWKSPACLIKDVRLANSESDWVGCEKARARLLVFVAVPIVVIVILTIIIFAPTAAKIVFGLVGALACGLMVYYYISVGWTAGARWKNTTQELQSYARSRGIEIDADGIWRQSAVRGQTQDRLEAARAYSAQNVAATEAAGAVAAAAAFGRALHTK
jgi:hypothetical protein